MAKYKTALVTGGAGFIGSHVADALIRRRIKVVVVDDLSRGKRGNVNPNAVFVKLSVANPQFAALLKRVKPDLVFHLAAQIDVRRSVDQPAEDARTNILGTLAIVEAARDGYIKKVIYASSGGVMYPASLRPPYSEDVQAQPISPYGIAKRASEMYLEFMHQMYGVPFVVLRYANVYGPRQDAKGEAGVVAVFGNAMLHGKPLTINGTGRQTRDFVYVEDVARANMLALGSAVGIFNIGTGRMTDINTIFKKLKHLTGADTLKRHGPAQRGELMHVALDCRRAARMLGWRPITKLDDGLKKTVAWFATNK